MIKNSFFLPMGLAVTCIALGNVNVVAQSTNATVALVPMVTAGVDDLAVTLPTPQTVIPFGNMVVEVWAQTSAPNGFAQVSADFSFPPSAFTVTSVAHTPLFSLFANHTIDNANGIVDDLTGSVTPVMNPPCNGQVGAAPQWARVAIIGMKTTAAGLSDFVVGPTNNPLFVNVNCGGFDVPAVTFLGASVTIEPEFPTDITIALVPRSSAGLEDLAATLPDATARVLFPGEMVVEVWAQTLAPNGLSVISVDFGFQQSAFAVNAVTHTALFSTFAHDTIDNVNGVVNDLSGAVAPVGPPPCSGMVGVAPQWARVAIIRMQPKATGTSDLVIGPTNNAVFVNANCGLIDPPPLTFVGASVLTIVNPDPIPAASSWGLLAMAILLLTLGTALIHRNEPLEVAR